MLKSKALFILVVLAVMVAPFASFVAFADHDVDPCAAVTLYNGWVRATPEGAPNSAVFGLVVNLSDEDDTLVGGSAEIAEAVEIHEMIMGTGDVMQMQPVEGGLGVASRSYAELKPGSYHIMLIGLTAPLVAGEELELTLNFEHAGEVDIIVPILEMTEMGMPMMGEDHADVMATEEAEHAEEVIECGALQILNGWVRASGAGQPNSAAYVLIVNPGHEDDHLLSASTDVASTVELHEMVMTTGDVMQMSPLPDGIHIPHRSAVALQPGGLHIMLIGLAGELAVGSEVDITLNFEHAGELTLTFPVLDAEAMMTGMGTGMNGMMAGNHNAGEHNAHGSSDASTAMGGGMNREHMMEMMGGDMTCADMTTMMTEMHGMMGDNMSSMMDMMSEMGMGDMDMDTMMSDMEAMIAGMDDAQCRTMHHMMMMHGMMMVHMMGGSHE